MKHPSTKLSLAVMILVILACGGSAAPEGPPTVIVVIEPTATAVPAPAEIVHNTIPNSLPAGTSGIAADQDSARTAGSQSAPGGDRFTYGEYERPFNAIAMDKYFPYLDIQQYEIRMDDLWVYASITVRSLSTEKTLPGQYALEIDNDIDGKGDFLIVATNPSSTDWTTDNVQVWEDTNNDVGGVEPVKKDNVDPGFVDGFETNVFDSGSGSDPDAAWMRISPDSPLVVQIAFKRTLINDDGKFLVGSWAGTLLDPSLFDFNDRMTEEEAGAAVRSFAYYPIQFLSEMDNACRVPIGILISSDDLGLCQPFEPTPVHAEEQVEPGSSGCSITSCPKGGVLDPVSCECLQNGIAVPP